MEFYKPYSIRKQRLKTSMFFYTVVYHIDFEGKSLLYSDDHEVIDKMVGLANGAYNMGYQHAMIWGKK